MQLHFTLETFPVFFCSYVGGSQEIGQPCLPSLQGVFRTFLVHTASLPVFSLLLKEPPVFSSLLRAPQLSCPYCKPPVFSPSLQAPKLSCPYCEPTSFLVPTASQLVFSSLLRAPQFSRPYCKPPIFPVLSSSPPVF